MAPRALVLHPDPILRRKAEPVARVDSRLQELAYEMISIMALERGFGLAAPQVGESVRLFVTQGMAEGDLPIVYVNPRFIAVDGALEGEEEGCLSLPAIRGQVRRQKHVVIEAQDLTGLTFRLEADDWHARCWQHEMDHLDGILIIDRMSAIDRLVNRKKLRALEAAHEGV
ncbi:MAG: peptide deformylase [Phycisphaerales bacterium]|nr:peptide deformylase [Phycisphaerales bacterium]